MKHTVDKKTIKGGKYDKVPENYNGTVYICPMHPEVRDVEKSDCPICGMFLQPEDEIDGASHVEHNHSDNYQSHQNHHHENNHNHEHNQTHCHGSNESSAEVKSVKP